MASASISIVKEFLRLGSPQAKKSSLTALSVIDSEESAMLIADIVLRDDDESVRQRAVEEMFLLDQEVRKAAVDILSEGLLDDDRQKQRRAYLILGKLKNEGWHIPKVPMTWTNRVSFVTSIYSSFYPQRGWRFRLRSATPGMLGSAVGLLPLVGYLLNEYGLGETRGEFLVGVLLIAFALFVGLIFSVASTQFTSPIYLQLWPFTAAFMQVLLTFYCTLVALWVMYFVFPAFFFHNFLSFLPLLALLAAFVRLGTLLPLVFLETSRNSKSNWFVETSWGIITGISLATLAYLLYLRKADRYDISAYTVTWLVVLGSIVGMAHSFAKIDTEVL